MGVDILLAEGEVLGLLGESGSGKDVAVSAKHPNHPRRRNGFT
jgi:ABC-type dipeptide/oligopeptide/nickel transport system ATPase component